MTNLSFNQNSLSSRSSDPNQTVPALTWNPFACGNGNFYALLENGQAIKVLVAGIEGRNCEGGMYENIAIPANSDVFCEFEGTPEMYAICHIITENEKPEGDYRFTTYRNSLYVYHNGDIDESILWEICEFYGFDLDKIQYIETEEYETPEWKFRAIFHEIN